VALTEEQGQQLVQMDQKDANYVNKEAALNNVTPNLTVLSCGGKGKVHTGF
jgi:hypothetical protein